MQIRRDSGLQFLCRGRDLERDNVARVCAGSFAQLPIHFEPVALLAVWLEHGLKREAIDRAFDRRHPTRREFRTGVLRQDEKHPIAVFLALRRPDEFRFETDLRSGLCHRLLPSSDYSGYHKALYRPDEVTLVDAGVLRPGQCPAGFAEALDH